MNFEAIKKAAQDYRPAMAKFLRDMIAIPSESCQEEGVVRRIAQEMESLGYDKVEFDKLGNVIGWMGTGDRIIALDSHIDTVGIGNIENWEADPYQGYETDEVIYGRGGSDQEGGMAAATYGARIMKDLDLIPQGYRIMVVGSVQEEDCDGMCWQSIVNEYFNGPEDARNQVEFVISTEPTDGGIYRGHRGRMEIRVDMHGVSCHGSAPERGDNAIHKMAEVLLNIRDLNENPADGSRGLDSGLLTCGQIAIVLIGAFPMVEWITRTFGKPLEKIGAALGMNEQGSAGMVANLANNIAMFNIMGEMNPKGKLLNVAFAVSAAFVFGDHLGFTAGNNPDMIFPVIVGKLVAGVTAIIVANILAPKLLAKIENVKF